MSQDPEDLRALLLQLNARSATLERRIEQTAQATDALGTRTEALEADFRELMSIMEGFVNRAATEHSPARHSASYSWYERRPGSYRTPARVAAVLLLAMLSLVGVYLLLVGLPAPIDPVLEAPERPPVASQSEPEPVQREPASAPASAPAAITEFKEPPVVTTPTRAIPAPSALSAPAAVRVDLLLEATEPTWISVTPVDGEKLIDRLLEPGEPAWVKLEGPARLRAGNAGGLLATVGGKKVGPIGPHGRVREIDIYSDGTFKFVPRTPAGTPPAP